MLNWDGPAADVYLALEGDDDLASLSRNNVLLAEGQVIKHRQINLQLA